MYELSKGSNRFSSEHVAGQCSINVRHFDHEGLCQLQNLTDEDLRGRNVLHLSTTVLLRVRSKIYRPPLSAL